MAIENSVVRDHIQQTLERINRLDTPGDPDLRKQFSQMIGDQYEALIGLSVSELRQIAAREEAEK